MNADFLVSPYFPYFQKPRIRDPRPQGWRVGCAQWTEGRDLGEAEHVSRQMGTGILAATSVKPRKRMISDQELGRAG